MPLRLVRMRPAARRSWSVRATTSRARPNGIGKSLLIDLAHQQRIALAGRREVQQMAREALANRAEGRPSEGVEDPIQQSGHLLGERPGHPRILHGERAQRRSAEHQQRAVGYSLGANGHRASDRGRGTERRAGTRVAHRELAALDRAQVDPHQTGDDQATAGCILVSIHHAPGRHVDQDRVLLWTARSIRSPPSWLAVIAVTVLRSGGGVSSCRGGDAPADIDLDQSEQQRGRLCGHLAREDRRCMCEF